MAALALVLAATLAGPVPAGAETTIDVDPGYGGWFVPGEEVPVRVQVSADRLLRGVLEVAVGNPENATPVAMAIEVPGGSQKQFILTARAGLNQSPDVTARLRQDARVVASGRSSLQSAADAELVGVLPGATRGRALPGVATLAVDAGTARFTALTEAELEQAPASLGPLSTLAADSDELVRLSPAARDGVLRWVDGGGRLLVDAAKGQPVAGLPDGWQPGARGRASAGLGEVVATDGAIAAGRWAGLVEPSGRATANSVQGDIPLASSLASDAGLRTPELGWLVGFLAVYVLVVGPVLFLAVRRAGRPELAWVAVPLVAVLFSTGSYVVGRDLRKATQLVHATILRSGDTGGSATSFVGVFSRSGETVSVGFPSGWTTGAYTQFGPAPAQPSVVTRTADGPEARVALDAGQFGMVQGAGPAEAPSGLEITATVDRNGNVAGTVRNPTTFRLEEVAVLMGSAGAVLGDLGPKEERTFSVTSAGGAFRGDNAAVRAWGGFRPDRTDQAADFGLWQAAIRESGTNYTAPGAVVAAGFTRDFTPEIRVDGRTRRPEGRTLVVGRRQALPGPEGPLGPAVRRDVVRDPFSKFGPIGRNASSVVRYLLPPGSDPTKLTLQNPFGAAEVWQDGAWRSIGCAAPACQGAPPNPGAGPLGLVCPSDGPCFPPGRGLELTVPAAAVRDGVVWARVQGPASVDGGLALIVGRAA